VAAGVEQPQPQLTGVEHELQPQFQWAVKQRQWLPRWHDRHFPQLGLQPQSGVAVVQVTGVEQPQLAGVEQPTVDEHELQPQWLKMPASIPRPQPPQLLPPQPQPPPPLPKAL
jgi:hypothetical protein